MQKIKKIVNASWFKAAVAGGIATLLIFQGDKFYAGIAYGYAIREFLLGFKVEENTQQINS
tara:strand:+ start:438 stop:620 length:183 start_codon:yes stop_codon:yes gene_type:complete